MPQDLQLRKLSRAIEQNPSMVIITDVTGCIEYINPRFSQITGFQPPEVIGKNPRILKSNKNSPTLYQNLWDTISSGREWRGEIHNKKKNGDYYWVSASISPIKDDNGEITHFIGLQEDITKRKQIERENKRLFKAVQHQHAQLISQAQQLRHLAQQVVTAQEAERYRVSRELHDVTGQMLALIKIHLESFQIDLLTATQEGASVDAAPFGQDLTNIIALCEQTMAQIRLLAHDLRPSALDDLGLNMALKTLCKEFGRCGHLRIDYKGIDNLNIPPDTVGISLYRVLQEALTNVTRHAQANHVEVRLEKKPDGICLLIKDNGRGFANSQDDKQPKGMGLLSMAERLEALNGRLEIQTKASQGTQLLAFIPQENWK